MAKSQSNYLVISSRRSSRYEVITGCEQIANDMKLAFNWILKYSVSGKKETLAKAIDTIESLLEKEKVALMDFIGFLKKQS